MHIMMYLLIADRCYVYLETGKVVDYIIQIEISVCLDIMITYCRGYMMDIQIKNWQRREKGKKLNFRERFYYIIINY